MERINQMSKIKIWFFVAAVIIFFLYGVRNYFVTESQASEYSRIIIDSDGPGDPWGKSIGDINGDGLLDLVVGGHSSGGLVWYQNPNWEKHEVDSDGKFGTDHEVADLDNDGKNDIVSIKHSTLVWYRNGKNPAYIIDRRKLHDIEVSDLDGDGDLDIVARNQGAFGKGGGSKIFIYSNDGNKKWSITEISCPDGEGLKIADINNDSKPDIIVNGIWFENHGSISGRWKKRRFTSSWTWPHTFIDVNDINGDSRADIILSPAEHEGQTYRISWFESPEEFTGEWVEHTVAHNVEAVYHYIGTADMNRDGTIDIVSAEMHQGKDPDEISIHFNMGKGLKWMKKVLADTGSHGMRLVDIENDGDMDLFGANWSGEYQSIELWKNNTCQNRPGAWKRHIVDKDRPWLAVFVSSSDLDGDGYKDIVTGGWWYQNPGKSKKKWLRQVIGDGVNNMAVLSDFDADGDVDILGTAWKDTRADSRLAWAENDGKGRFRIHPDLGQGGGDFLQGAAVGHLKKSDRTVVFLSWHKTQVGVQMLEVPNNPDKEKWSISLLSSVSQDEQISPGDIDSDGDLDLFLGTKWLRNDGNDKWQVLTISDKKMANPDRNRLADINGDGRLDAIVGFEAISKPGDLVWFESGKTVTAPDWKMHKIARITGPMSLDVADMDNDGDFDVIAGEHNIKNPDNARLMVFENLDGKGNEWKQHIVYTGDEHHDGAQTVDIDNDGDLDILSIGWSHNKVLLYENLSVSCK